MKDDEYNYKKYQEEFWQKFGKKKLTKRNINQTLKFVIHSIVIDYY